MRDPVKAWARTMRAQRRAGEEWACSSCKEDRPHAKFAEVCFECERLARGREPLEDHHVFGRANGKALLRVPVNDHRAELSVAQYSWPPDTLSNPRDCLLREAAARLRGRADLLKYMIEDSIACAERLERQCATQCQHKHGGKYGRKQQRR